MTVIISLITEWIKRQVSFLCTSREWLSAHRVRQAKVRNVSKQKRLPTATFPKRVEKVNRKEFMAQQFTIMVSSAQTVIKNILYTKRRNTNHALYKAHRHRHQPQAIM